MANDAPSARSDHRPYLSIVIPAYNEAERLPATLLDIVRRLSAATYSFEIIVVNDGSRDATSAVTEDLKKVIANLRLVENSTNQGKGAVVRQGMLLAQGQYRLFTDADNSTSIDHFQNMLPYFHEGYDVVICDRALRGRRLEPPQPLYRQIPGKFGNLIIQLLLLPGIWDSQCGFKAFSASAAEDIFRRSRIKGWAFDAEILALAKQLKYKIKEIPVRWVDDRRPRLRTGAYLEVLWQTLLGRLRLWRGIYDLGGGR